MRYIESFLDGIDSVFAWLSSSLKQTTEAYCELETADSANTLVAHDGSLISVVEIYGASALMGMDEFNKLRRELTQSFRPGMSQTGHAMQVYFGYSQDRMGELIQDVFGPAKQTAKTLELELGDLFTERERHLSSYCAEEKVYLVLWTKPTTLTKDQLTASRDSQTKMLAEKKITKLGSVTQNLLASIPEIRNSHDAFVKSIVSDLGTFNMDVELLGVHDALFAIRNSVDPEFTSKDWRASLPGDHIPVREVNNFKGDVSDLLWPSLAKQVIPDRKSVV